jgi:hypothetical protein
VSQIVKKFNVFYGIAKKAFSMLKGKAVPLHAMEALGGEKV